jgi:predicted molibdopterin-dependent oxidoreductase YjgC
MSGRFVRLAETERPSFEIVVDGAAVAAFEGDTVLTAMLATGTHVRHSEFGDGRRAGFCVMGACQDCWVWAEDGRRLRACSTPAVPGLRLKTLPPDATWSHAR